MEENKQEFDKRDLNKDGKVSLGEKIGYGIDKAQEKLEEAAELKGKASEKFAEMKEETKEAADKAKAKFDSFVAKKDGEEKA